MMQDKPKYEDCRLCRDRGECLHPATCVSGLVDRDEVLEQAAAKAKEMREKHSKPCGGNYTCGAWDMGVRIEQQILKMKGQGNE